MRRGIQREVLSLGESLPAGRPGYKERGSKMGEGITKNLLIGCIGRKLLGGVIS